MVVLSPDPSPPSSPLTSSSWPLTPPSQPPTPSSQPPTPSFWPLTPPSPPPTPSPGSTPSVPPTPSPTPTPQPCTCSRLGGLFRLTFAIYAGIFGVSFTAAMFFSGLFYVQPLHWIDRGVTCGVFVAVAMALFGLAQVVPQ